MKLDDETQKKLTAIFGFAAATENAPATITTGMDNLKNLLWPLWRKR